MRGKIVLFNTERNTILLHFKDDRYVPYVKGLFSSWMDKPPHVLITDWRFLLTATHKKYYSLLDIKLVVFPVKRRYILCIKDVRSPQKEKRKYWKFISHEYFQWFVEKTSSQTPLPFVMHSTMYTFNCSVNFDKKRQTRVFFSGNSDRKTYSNPIVNEVFGIMNRVQIIDALKENAGRFGRDISFDGNANALIQIMDWEWNPEESRNLQLRVDNEQWLNKLGDADFFLCGPGIMPFCHNTIEAMAMGCIPILQYHQLFVPKLEDGVNCITFKNADDLVNKIEGILKKTENEIREMRENVRNYYDEYLCPESIRALLTSSNRNEFLFPVNIPAVNSFASHKSLHPLISPQF